MTLHKRIAIIGGGPSGLAAAKALVSEPVKFVVDLFERRDRLGGLWYYQGDKTKVSPPVPSTDPNGKEVLAKGASPANRFLSSMYDNLETNLVDKLMEYSGVQFEPRTMDFLTRDEVLQYIDKYAASIPGGVTYRFNSNVTRVVKENGTWSVTVEDTQTLGTAEYDYDAVVVANGHTELPYIPDVAGLAEWNVALPGTVSHARYFSDCKPYADKVVLVVGNYASGSDLATQIGTVAKRVYVSTVDEPKDTGVDYIRQVGVVTRYDHTTRTAHTTTGDVDGIDAVIYCTGYLYTFPFLAEQFPDLTDGHYVKRLYRQIFYVDDPSLAFVGLPKYISPLPFGEAQGAVLARVYSGRMSLPDAAERRRAYEEELAAKGTGKPFHSFKETDAAFCNEMYGWIRDAGADTEGLVPLWWDDEHMAQRRGVADVKAKRAAAAAEHARTLRAQGKPFAHPARTGPLM